LHIPDAASRLEIPWLIVHGREDRTVGVDEARALAVSAQDGLLVLVGGAGHTFEARHPFEERTPQLDEALDATVSHFALHLGD
jgi:pimeloyl-ACP methyl ester carboxylesterase